MSNLLEELVPKGPPDLCFESSAFTKESFSVDQFLQDHRSGANLETMRDDLGVYLKVLRSAMIDLINKDYADYVNLSSNLMGLDKAIGNINTPLGQLREELLQVNQYINNAISEMTLKLEQKKALREKKRSLRCLARVRVSLGKLQALLSTGASEMNGVEISKDMAVVERAVSEYSQLQFNAEKCLHLMNPQEKQVFQEVGEVLVSKISSLFENLFNSRNEQQLALCLNYSLQINAQQHIERLFRQRMVGPAMEGVINKENLRSQARGLSGLYDKILHYIDYDMKQLLFITTNYRGMDRYDFLVKGVWSEIERRLQLNLSSIYDVGDANTFYQRYSETMKFLEELSARLGSYEARSQWTNLDSYNNFITKWNLPVYFQIRYQEIVRYIETELGKGCDISNDTPWKLISSQCIWNAITRCWAQGVYIQAIADKMFKLTLQILSRYHVWVQYSLKQTESSDKTDLFVYIYSDVKTLIDKSPLIVSMITLSVPSISSNTSTSLSKSVEESMSQLSDELSSIQTAVISSLTSKSCSFLRQVSDIPRLYRRTNREQPTKACSYVMSMIEPAKLFHSKHSEAAPTLVWLQSVFSQLTKQYLKLVSEVLTSVQKTEESLRRLKKARQTANSAPTVRTPDDDKIRLQLLIDVTTYKQQIDEIGLEENNIEGLRELLQLVETSNYRL